MHEIIRLLRHRLIVSCQAAPNDPMEDTETLRRVARSAMLGGGQGFRLNGPQDIRAVRLDSRLPIIGIQKNYTGGQLRITPDFASAAILAKAGAEIVALDCTDREHAYGEPWREIVARIHAELGLLVMADIATVREGVAAAQAGVDLVGTTLYGYTAETRQATGFNPGLVFDLQRETGKAIVAEGHVGTPGQAREAIEAGAWCVVVGSAITRPGTITANFVREMQAAATALSAAKPKEERYVAAIDLGGTFTKAAIVSESGAVQYQQQVPTVISEGRDGIARSLGTAVDLTLQAAQKAQLHLVGIGIASAGAIDAQNGIVFAATENLPGWAGFDFRAFLKSHTSLPVFVENDAQAAALAELRFGASVGLASFVALTVGTGIGGGIVLDGKLQRGHYGFAGTVGHQTIRFDGRPCNCGRRGCLEAYVSTAALIYEFRELASGHPLKGTAAEMAREIAQLAETGNAAAVAAYNALAAYLAEGVANLANILDPEAVILSGGLIDSQPGFLEEVQARAQSLLHFGQKRPPHILRAHAGVYAGVQGAAATVFEQLPATAPLS
jgi:glucokinase-like ROK family protein